MKFFVVLALFATAALAGPVSSDPKDHVVVRNELDNIGVDGFKYGYETSGGIAAEEQGVLKNVGTEQEAIEVRGSFSYVAPDGVQYTVTYIANENGFQASGAHLPVGPQ